MLLFGTLPLFALGFGHALIRQLHDAAWRPGVLVAFAGGAAGCAGLAWVLRRYARDSWHYLATCEHELTHALVGLLFLKIPVAFRVSARAGGYVGFRHGANLWITLAPYYLPTVSLLLLLCRPLFGHRAAPVFFVALGGSVAFHLLTTWEETSWRQPDLQQAGRWTSLCLLPVLNLLSYGSLAGYLARDVAGLREFWHNGGQQTATLMLNLCEAVRF